MKEIFINKYLLLQMIKKDIRQKYNGSILGVLWSIIIPLFMMVIYTFVFSVIFQTKWDLMHGNKFDFALFLFCGLTCFNMISEVMNRATTIIAGNVNYVKKVIFPLEIFPITITFTSLFNAIISFIILIVAKVILTHKFSITLYQIVLVLIPLFILSLGLGLIISAFSVYLKDMSNLMSILTIVLMYISPVFYPMTSVPIQYQFLCKLNPLTYIVENMRNTILYDKNIEIYSYLISMIVSCVLFFAGRWVFGKAKDGFADVL